MASPDLPAGVRVSYRRHYTRCNRRGCRACLPPAPGHGPYWYAYWREGGRLRSRYLGKQAPPGAAPLGVEAAIPALRVQSLGAFAVWCHGERIPDSAWKRRKAASLFKALLSAPEYRLHREQLAELLWPDSDPVSADSCLRFTLHQLRSMLDPPGGQHSFILSRDHLLILAPDPGRDEERTGQPTEEWLDAARFSTAAGQALTREDPRVCKTALAHYTGPYLPDDRYEDWALPRSEELARQHVALLLHQARIVSKLGPAGERAAAWRAVLAADPCHEEAAYALMRILGEDGHSAEALRIYGAFAAALRAELQVSPAAAIERLRARLSTPPSDPSEVESTDPPMGARTNLPTAQTSFVGRQREQRLACELLDATRLLTLTGIGGAGKTRLALQVAESLLDRFPDGIWLVELALVTDPASIPALAARAMGMPESLSTWVTPAALTQYLHGRRLLLLLDNCEHLIAACAALVSAVLACPGPCVLATSREALGLPGETTFRVPPLSLPPRDRAASPGDLLEYEAARLFLERARAHRPDFAFTEHNASAINAICTRLDGLPLAIELAAARIRSLSVETIDARLDHCFQLLTGGPRTALPRHHTLRATLDWSYDLLSLPERVLLRRLAIFTSGWTLEDAEAICAGEPVGDWEVLDVLTMLVDKSLVEVDGRESGTRYWLQEPMRQYAQEKLLASSDIAWTKERCLAWYSKLAEERSGRLGAE